MSNSESKFTIAIVGGGIGGLTLAITLTDAMKRSGQKMNVHVYESAAKFTEVGAGVALFPRPSKVLSEVGLKDDLECIAFTSGVQTEAPFMTFMKGDQEHGTLLHDLQLDEQTTVSLYHRYEFLEVLAKNLDPDYIQSHFGKRLVTYTQRSLTHDVDKFDKIFLSFKDGSTAHCDVLIGADGVHSATRECMYTNMYHALKPVDPVAAENLLRVKQPVWSGWYAYRGVIPSEALAHLQPNHRALTRSMNYLGKNRDVVVLPIAGGRRINIVASMYSPGMEGAVYEDELVKQCSQEEMLANFVGWDLEVLNVLKCIQKPSRWAIIQLNNLPQFSIGQIAVMGDAAHAMVPFQASGAGQAVEDAYTLANLLAHPRTNIDTVTTALEVYDEVRRPIANEVQRLSSLNGRFYSFNDPRFDHLAVKNPPVEELDIMAEEIVNNWRWAWMTDCYVDRANAVQLFEKKVTSVA